MNINRLLSEMLLDKNSTAHLEILCFFSPLTVPVVSELKVEFNCDFSIESFFQLKFQLSPEFYVAIT